MQQPELVVVCVSAGRHSLLTKPPQNSPGQFLHLFNPSHIVVSPDDYT